MPIKWLARWSLWLDETLLGPVPHRQVVLTIPKGLRAYCLYRRALLGAARTVTAAVRATSSTHQPVNVLIRHMLTRLIPA